MKNSIKSGMNFYKWHRSRRIAENSAKPEPTGVSLIQRQFISSELGAASVETVVLIFATISMAIASSIVVSNGTSSLGATTVAAMNSATEIEQSAKNGDSSGDGSDSGASGDDESSDEKKAKKEKKKKERRDKKAKKAKKSKGKKK